MKRTTLMVIAVAGLGLASCSGDRTGGQKEPAATATPAKPAASAALLALLPSQNEVAGWAVSRTPRGFTAENLWELINGAADGFVTYGVQEVVTADYTQAGSGLQAVVEIYQMKDPLNAYGKYSEERNPDSRFIEVGNEGYSGGTAVNFWNGQYYVKVTGFEEKAALEQELVKLAQAIAAKVPARSTEPAELSYFPRENQLPHTMVYIPKDVLAQSYFTNGFEAKYKAGGKEYKAVVVGLESPAAAQDAMTRYRQYVSKDGKGLKALRAPADGGFAAKDSFYGNLIAVRAGKHVVVALGAASEDAGKKLVAEVARNIK